MLNTAHLFTRLCKCNLWKRSADINHKIQLNSHYTDDIRRGETRTGKDISYNKKNPFHLQMQHFPHWRHIWSGTCFYYNDKSKT